MFCWQARRGFAEKLDEKLDEKLEMTAGLAGSPLDQHLSGCTGCTAELAGLRQLRSLLSESARATTISPEAPSMEADAFEERVLRLARSRAPLQQTNVERTHGQQTNGQPTNPDGGRRAWLGALSGLPAPLPVAMAFSLMLASVVLSHFFSGAVPAGGPIPSGGPMPAAVTSQTAASNDLDDRIVAPQEVPFVVQEDLVGARRGRIPLTTYVLEPAPDEQVAPRTGAGAGAGKPVMRASL